MNGSAVGKVSNLFSYDKTDEILDELTVVMKQKFLKQPPINENLYDYFFLTVTNYILFKCKDTKEKRARSM
jgi:hypothetical protein